MSDAERAFAASWWVVDDLVRFGMEHACVSPGSRSTPLALALSRHPHVRVHVLLDERAAAFFALGIAKATGRPAAVATTSGTAAAELLPAVVEASMSRTTLFLLTADRPPELRGVGANQTIEQPGIFGGYVRASIDAPVPGESADEETWHDLLDRATRASMGPPPGPVHLNLPFREPLGRRDGIDACLAAPGTESTMSAAPEPEEFEALERELTSTDRGLMLAGSMRGSPATLLELARRAGWPLLAEPTSNLRVDGSLSAGQFLLAERAVPALAHARRRVAVRRGSDLPGRARARPPGRAARDRRPGSRRRRSASQGRVDPARGARGLRSRSPRGTRRPGRGDRGSGRGSMRTASRAPRSTP